MNQKKTILVTGATGAQGGSVAKALLAENNFTVRVFTRNAQSEKALELQQAGAEVVTGDLDDIDSIKNAMHNCYGVFGVTNFWEHFEKEYQQGKNLIEAVKQMNVEHFVLHTLPDYNKLSNGQYPTPHCDIKAALQAYTNTQNIPATFMQVAFYYENFFTFFPLQKSADGGYSFGFPQGDTKLAMVSIEDLGPVVAAVFNHPAEYIGRTVGVVGADDTCYEYAATLSRVLEKKVNYHYIPRDEYAALGFAGAEELANMFEVQRLYIPQRQIDLIESYGLNPAMQPFERWLSKNKSRFTAMMQTEEAITA
ncbi:MAG: NmrA-like family domain containing 1 [Ferruginibacter sp.]|uniref:NmrA/HSCARG family protein n=1 Tax=Ferruginibacter sp. TaxID=1940288 RepID=UPI00265A14E9|nr:NmrA/HSCARG family protein [Ferruginibacter sp.]MDB5278709.1 NmrA-like family domain containing 1 [Ferruginibacter sp.]